MTESAPLIDFEALLRAPAVEIARICTIQTRNLMRDVQTQPAIFAYAVASREVAISRAVRLKYEHKKVRSRVAAVLLEEGYAVSKIDLLLDDDSEVQRTMAEYLAADEKARIIGALCAALEQRRDALLQLSPLRREEYKATRN